MGPCISHFTRAENTFDTWYYVQKRSLSVDLVPDKSLPMNREMIIQTLMDMGAISLSLNPPYTFSSGIKSPIYCDNRLLISNLSARNLIIDAFCEFVPRGTEQIAGVATAGIPWASWVAQKLNLPMIYVRSKPKEHGQTNQIEGKLIHEETVLIEDLISTAGSSLKALDALRDEDVFVTQILAIFSYQFTKTIKTLNEYEIKAQTIVEFGDLLAFAKEHSYLTEEEIRKVLNWQKDPDNWSP